MSRFQDKLEIGMYIVFKHTVRHFPRCRMATRDKDG
jgi:hypothetical protein